MHLWPLSISLLLSQAVAVLESNGNLKAVSCWKHWLKMTDNNYVRALERYDSCGSVLDELTGDMRERYKRSLADNLQKSSNYFFDHTEMSPAEVIRVLRKANYLMGSWVGSEEEDPFGNVHKNAKYQECCQEEEDDDDAEYCSYAAFKWYIRSKNLFYGFVVLLIIQSILLVILFCKVCYSDLLMCLPTGPYDGENKEWIANLINECEANLARQCRPEAYPLLISQPEGLTNFVSGKSKSATVIGYGTHIGDRLSKEDEILTDLSPLSSPRLRSDSEFEALMSRKALKAVQRSE